MFSLLVCFVLSAVCLFGLRSSAHKFKLVDEPCNRKRHREVTPLLGGISVFVGFFAAVIVGVESNPMLQNFLLAASLMVVLGVLDDKYDVSAKTRLFGQIVIASVLILIGGAQFQTLGDLLGFGSLTLGWFSLPFTYLAILAAINAFNMIDGIDGLLGGTAFVTFMGISVLAALHGASQISFVSLLIAVGLIPFIVLNLGLTGLKRKVFMGDAGSMFIGLSAVWLLIVTTQYNYTSGSVRPVTALWLVALPIMDIVTVIIGRLMAKKPLMKAARDHVHHDYLNAGFAPKHALLILLGFSIVMTLVGILGELFKVYEPIMFLGFLSAYAGYLGKLKWLRSRAVLLK